MGFDLYGVNPRINREYPKKYETIMKEYGTGDGWIDWKKDVPDNVKEEYFDIKEQYEEDNPGYYFRNNVWWWRPVWEFVCHHCSDFLDDEDMARGHDNSGHEISENKAVKIGGKLSELLADGTVDFHDREHRLSYERAKANNEEVEKELDALRKEVKEQCGENIVPMNYPGEMKEKYEKIYAKRDWDGHYPFHKENIKDFAVFCLNSGGFEIC